MVTASSGACREGGVKRFSEAGTLTRYIRQLEEP